MQKIFLGVFLVLIAVTVLASAQGPVADFKAEKLLLRKQHKIELQNLKLQWSQWKESIKGQQLPKAEITRMKHEMQRKMRDLKLKQKDERQELKDRQRLLKEYERNIH